ncbi:MAG: endonuclease/exonuclease/phosphatase family protein [Chloroflexota bacterium]
MPSDRIRVMTFNVRGSFEEKHPERLWKNRAATNVETIRRHSPDLIGFQEVASENRAVYEKELPGYTHTTGRPTTLSQESRWVTFNPIYWKADRFTLVDSGGFFLSPQPDQWSKGWDAAFVRAATWVRLRSTTTGMDLLHLNTHLDHVGEEARQRSTHLIINRLNQLQNDLPLLVSADFNSRAWAPVDEAAIDYPPAVHRDALPPGGTVHKLFMQAGFRDTYCEAGNRDHLDMNTFHAFMGGGFPPCALRIDWILTHDGARRWHTRDYAIIRDHSGRVYPSDHYPVMANLVLE